MPYASFEDLLDRCGEAELSQIGDRDGSGTPDPEAIEASLRDADSLIDGYIAARYATPLPSVPPLVRTWAVSIARYTLHRNGAPEHVAQDYKDTVAALRDAQQGRLMLPVPAGAANPNSITGTVMASHPDQVFDRRKMRGWNDA